MGLWNTYMSKYSVAVISTAIALHVIMYPISQVTCLDPFLVLVSRAQVTNCTTVLPWVTL